VENQDRLKLSINKKRRNKMGRHILAIAAISLMLVGCNVDQDNAVSPFVESYTDLGTEVSPDWIVLPARSDLSVEGDVSVSKMVKGNEETLLEINTGYQSGNRWIQITANARFQRNSFSGQRYITMSINDEFGTATFSPSGTFSKPVIYNLTIMGLDLSGVNPSKVKFVYFASNGNYYQPKYKYLYVEKQSGKLQINDAELPHFSRFGFTR
jgi:hypothetical protein